MQAGLHIMHGNNHRGSIIAGARDSGCLSSDSQALALASTWHVKINRLLDKELTICLLKNKADKLHDFCKKVLTWVENAIYC
jgi:hypothetical protein